MKRLSLVLTLAVGVVVGFFCGAALTVAYSDQAHRFDYNQVIAMAGETPVTRGRLADRTIMLTGAKLLDSELKSQALIAEAARAANITATPEEVAARITSYRQLLDQYADLAELLGTRKALDALPRWYLEDQYYHTLLAEKLLRISVNEEDIRECYYTHMRQFRKPAMAKLVYIVTDNRANAELAHAGLREGMDARRLSEKYSSEKSIRDEKGDIGWVAPSSLRPECAEAVFRGDKGQPLKPKQFTRIIPSQEGGKDYYFVFYVEGFREEQVVPLAEVRPAVEFVARMIKLSNALDAQKWFEVQEKKTPWRRVPDLADPNARLDAPAK